MSSVRFRNERLITDCSDEAEFVELFCQEFGEMAKDAVWIYLASTNNKTEGQPSLQAIDVGLVVAASELCRDLMPLAFEILLKLRGYKSKVQERRLLWTGDPLPQGVHVSIEDDDALIRGAHDAGVITDEALNHEMRRRARQGRKPPIELVPDPEPVS